MVGRGVASVGGSSSRSEWAILQSTEPSLSLPLSLSNIIGHDTGYKHGDPTHPCRRCWQSYGQRYNPLIVSSAGLQGSKVLQRPLIPSYHPNGTTSPQGYTLSGGRAQGGNTGYPGSSNQYQYQQQHQHLQQHQQHPHMQFQRAGSSSSSSYQSPETTGVHQSPFNPPPAPHRRRSPPQVMRADDAREDNADEDGEAPPAYADAVAAGPDSALPPQRRDEQGRLVPVHAGNNHVTSQPTGGSSFSSSSSPPPRPSSHHQNITSSSSLPPPAHPGVSTPHLQTSFNNLTLGDPFMHAAPPQPFHLPPQVISYGHGPPPPGALILRPGDPRIGGRLCYKCGGAGARDSLFWGSETCHHCGGSGRML
jgi:hypothetical protein